MKIGFDAKRLYNNFTGLGNHSRTTLDILSEYYPDNRYILYTPSVKYNEITSHYLEMENCDTIVPKGLFRGSLWRTFFVAQDTKHDEIDLFHGLSNELPVGLKVPSVVTIHDVAFRGFREMYHWQDRKIYDIKWRYACNNADRIIAISEYTKSDIVKYYNVDPDKIDVVYQPVSQRYYEEVEKRREVLHILVPYILYVGSINSRKNLLGAIKAIQLLPSDLQLPLVVVGNGREYKNDVEAYISSNGLQDMVLFQDHDVSDEELQQLYLHAELFVYPSFYEGFGLPVVEALLSHCPVVTSNVSSLPEAAGAMSLKANPEDIKDISANIERVLTDEDLRKKMKSAGYDYAMKTFNPEVSAKKLMEIYKRVKR